MNKFGALKERLEGLSLFMSVIRGDEARMPKLSSPDKTYSDRGDSSSRPSWSSCNGFLNQEHREVFEQTQDIPGFQTLADTHKLYEMAFFSGSTILEIGTYGGKSAVVEIKGALANRRRKNPPQYFGIDLDIEAIERTYDALRKENLHRNALLFYGHLESFSRKFSISPTMVFLDGDHEYEGVKKDLAILLRILAPGVPVLCHDYVNPENDTGEYGVRKAVMEWEEEGFAEFFGCFGCSALMVTTGKCQGQLMPHMPRHEFLRERNELLQTYFGYLGKKFVPGTEFCEFDKSDQLAYIRKKVFQSKNIEIEEKEEQILEPGAASAGLTVYDIFPEIDACRLPGAYFDIKEPFFWEVFERCKPYTLLSVERFYDIFKAVEHIARNKIPGDFVECGVYFGGAVMAMGLFAKHFGIEEKRFYLYDTFSGFPAGTTDVDYRGNEIQMESYDNFIDLVRENISSLDVDPERFVLVEGPVELTLERTTPESICLLRLDTDYYESTLVELQVLYPLLATGGVLIIDDYGYFEGVRKAVDQYFANGNDGIMLSRVDTNARSGIKMAPGPGDLR